MDEIISAEQLRANIIFLENKQAEEGAIMKAQFQVAYERAKPINLIKNTLNDLGHSQDLNNGLINTSIGLAAGYASKKIFEGVENPKLRAVLGTAFVFGATTLVAKNPDFVRIIGSSFFSLFKKSDAINYK